MQTSNPAQLILIEDLDELSLGAATAFTALKGVEILLDAQPEGYSATPREIAAILRCISSTAEAGWPFKRERR